MNSSLFLHYLEQVVTILVTDDTSMALCLMDGLLENKGYVPANQMNTYVQWYLGAKYCTKVRGRRWLEGRGGWEEGVWV
jgi:ADP-ribosylglycohydrolase